MILIVEDLGLDFDAVSYMVEHACVRLHIEPTIVRSTTLVEVEQHIAECEKQKTPLLIIFDNLMLLPGGKFEFIELIRTLWHANPETWRGRVPIIIYSDTRTEEFDRYHRRMNSATIHKLPEAGQMNRVRLRTAVYTALHALAVAA